MRSPNEHRKKRREPAATSGYGAGMVDPLRPVRPALSLLLGPPGRGVRPSLADLAAASRLSPFHFHRVFVAATGETPKQLDLRLRLGRAAADLVSTNRSVLSIAIAHGFGSHDGFGRAFRRRFGQTPREYRHRGLLAPPGSAARGTAVRNAAVVNDVGPCLRLYRRTPASRPNRTGVTPQEVTALTREIDVRDVPLQHTLVIRRRVAPEQIGDALGELLPTVFGYAQEIGAPLAGQPLVRYLELGMGSMLIEAGMPVETACPGRDEIVASTVGGHRVATTIHVGAYDRLSETYREIESWMDREGMRPTGAPWEQYLTDPTETPDVAAWRTAVCWPVTDRE